jgi:hypothetical protein
LFGALLSNQSLQLVGFGQVGGRSLDFNARKDWQRLP